VVSVNPLPEAGTERFVDPQSPRSIITGGTALSRLHVGLRINTDVALLKGVMRLLLEREDAAPGTVFDQRFIHERTEGYDAFISDLRTVDAQQMANVCGIPFAQLQQLADLCCSTDRIVITWAMGLTQHVNAVANVQQVVNLLLLRGAFGREGAGACPVRGHSNVQGDRTMGIYEKPSESFLQALDKRYAFTAPRAHGFDVVDCIEAMRDGRAKVFMALGGNFISATPDSEVTARSMMNCALTVQVSTKLNRSHIVTGEEAIILPCLGRSERDMPYRMDGTPVQGGRPQFVTVEDSMSVVHRSQGSHEPASPYLRSEAWIVCGIATATLGDGVPVQWSQLAESNDRIRDEIAGVIPGFHDFNQRVRKPDGFVLPNGARDGAKFTTPTGRARFSVDIVPEWNVPDGRFMMMTIRTHDQFNTTIYGLDDHYRGIHGERRVVLMHVDDMHAAGLRERDRVDIFSHYDRDRAAHDFFVLPYDIARGCVATYFPEANALVPLHLKAHRSGTPASKSVVVEVRRR
jgi:molybdopterin-dependent oxidoreductase alpha subunit